MGYPLYLVDAFAHGPFTGNPAAVCLLEQPAEEHWMQRVAMEMNQAETAFLVPQGNAYGLRWFTPTVEVDLCGHATLASAQVLFTNFGASDVIFFDTRSGRLSARQQGEEIELDFPVEAPVMSELPGQVASLGAAPLWTGRNRMDWFVRLQSADEVRAIQPDFAEIARLGMRGLIVTARDESDEYDFISRCFYPASGIDEDPATGSAHCALAAYWAEELGRTELTGYQASRRGGRIAMVLQGDRVLLRGRAITVLEGQFTV